MIYYGWFFVYGKRRLGRYSSYAKAVRYNPGYSYIWDQTEKTRIQAHLEKIL